MAPLLLFQLYCVLVLLASNGVLSLIPGLTEEYCMELFNPTCGPGEVIVMKHAFYGRMAIGKCVKMDSGLGCSSDELNHMDKECSGKRNCEIFIPNQELTSRLNCLRELSPYLEAAFTCQKVVNPSKDQCTAPEVFKVKKLPDYLSLPAAQGHNCGSRDAPFVLEAKPGQSINLTLLDFAWTKDHTRGCHVKYGYILDMESDDIVDICGGGNLRERVLYTSIGHLVQIVLDPGVSEHRALIGFKALGCPVYKTPADSWSEMENQTLVIVCTHSDSQWRVRCVDNHWLGMVGTCPPPQTTSTVDYKPVTPVKKSKLLPKMTDNHVIAFAMGCVTIIVCITVVMAGYYCTKRYEIKTQKLKMTNQGRLAFRGGTINGTKTLLGYTSKEALKCVPDIKENTMDLPPYAAPLKKEQRAPPVPNRMSSYKGDMSESMMSDYLAPQGGDGNSVQYYILENPTESGGKEEMYQSIHLFSSLERAPETAQ